MTADGSRRLGAIAAVLAGALLVPAPAYAGVRDRAGEQPGFRAEHRAEHSVEHRTVEHRGGDRPRAVVRTEVIGRSVQGRRIVARRLGNPDARRTVVVMAAMHGNEIGPTRIIRRLVHGREVRGADVWVIRTMNPDGLAHRRRQNARGVDLNRNFPRKWQRLRPPYYAGSRPASEPETRAVMRFLRRVRPDYVVSFHQPLGGVGRSGLARGRTLERRLSRNLRLPVRSFNCNSRCHGTMTEWFNHAFPHRIALTVEYGARMSRWQLRTAPDALLRAVGAHR